MDYDSWGDLSREDQIKWVRTEATWQELVDLLTSIDVECGPDIDPCDLLLNGCKGYRNMSKAELAEELEPFYNPAADPGEDDDAWSGGFAPNH